MSKSTISTFKLFELFPDEETARTYLEGRLWPLGAICPECKSGDRITKRVGGFYRCNACKVDFTVRTGTIFGPRTTVGKGTSTHEAFIDFDDAPQFVDGVGVTARLTQA